MFKDETNTIFEGYYEIDPMLSEGCDLEKLVKEIDDACVANRYAVSALVFLALQVNSPEQHVQHSRDAKVIHEIMQKYVYPTDNYKPIRQGILGEVAVNLALRELTFDVYVPTVEEDSIAKIDLWVDPRDGEKVFAIQVKTDFFTKDIFVIRPKVLPDGEVVGVNKSLRQDMTAMIKYLTTGEDLPNVEEIIPLLISVPGGEGNENSLYNQTTGVPLKGMSDELYDEIERVVFSKEAY